MSISDAVGTSADAAALLLATTTLTIALLRRSSAFRLWCLGLPLRRAVQGTDARTRTELSRILGVRTGRSPDVVAAMQAPSLKVLDGEGLTPGDALAELISTTRGGVVSSRRKAALLGDIYSASTRGDTSSLLARFLYPEDVTRVAQFHRALARALAPFAGARAIPSSRSGAAPFDPTHFAGFVTALSGAPVLVDTSTVRSRHADGLLTWHRRRFRGAHPDLDAHGYAGTHRDGPCAAWSSDHQQPGDFDRRMLDLRSVAMVESHERGEVLFALGTWETCYATTENGARRGCKKVPPDPTHHEVGLDPLFAGESPELAQSSGGRVTLLTSYVSVLTRDGVLALVRRSRSVRNGAGVISASAGGIVEIDEPGPTGDLSPLGLPDPLVTARREALEEIGLDLGPERIRPVAVFLANIRESGTAGPSRGQLVGVVLSLARVELTLEELRGRGETRSDMSKGRFEWDDFVACPTDSADTMATWARSRAPELDQHGLLSIVYTAMVRFGPEATRRAFEQAFADGPWWCGPAAGVADHRVCRDPGPMVGVATDQLLPTHPAAWRSVWEASTSGDPAARRAKAART